MAYLVLAALKLAGVIHVGWPLLILVPFLPLLGLLAVLALVGLLAGLVLLAAAAIEAVGSRRRAPRRR